MIVFTRPDISTRNKIKVDCWLKQDKFTLGNGFRIIYQSQCYCMEIYNKGKVVIFLPSKCLGLVLIEEIKNSPLTWESNKDEYNMKFS